MSRPTRKMPPCGEIHDYWAECRNGYWVYFFGQVSIDHPRCYCCHIGPEMLCENDWPRHLWGSFFDRAHIIDRSRDGLDGPQNLVLLCKSCHRAQPSFGPSDWMFFLEWVWDHGKRQRDSALKWTQTLLESDDPNRLIVARFGLTRSDEDFDRTWSQLPNWTPMTEWRMENAA